MTFWASLVLGWVPAVDAASQAAAGEARLAEGRLVEAAEAFEREADPAQRELGLARTYASAMHPWACLIHAERGLAAAPDDLPLRYQAVSAAVWIGEAERARGHLDRLATEVVESSDEVRTSWSPTVAAFGEQVAGLEDGRKSRAAAVRRARVVASVGLLGTLALMAVCAHALARSPRVGPQA